MYYFSSSGHSDKNKTRQKFNRQKFPSLSEVQIVNAKVKIVCVGLVLFFSCVVEKHCRHGQAKNILGNTSVFS